LPTCHSREQTAAAAIVLGDGGGDGVFGEGRGGTSGRKSGHKGEVEDEAGKRRKIDFDGFAEVQRVVGKEDAEKMEIDAIQV
jgi:hypothetical protein